MRSGRKPEGQKPVGAKELAEMGFCEQRVLLAHRHGQRLTPLQQRRAKEGRQAHQTYYREGLAAANAGAAQRCFVVSSLFGAEA